MNTFYKIIASGLRDETGRKVASRRLIRDLKHLQLDYQDVTIMGDSDTQDLSWAVQNGDTTALQSVNMVSSTVQNMHRKKHPPRPFHQMTMAYRSGFLIYSNLNEQLHGGVPSWIIN